MPIEFITDDTDDIDYGVSTQDLSVRYDNNVELKQNEIKNPFYVGLMGGNIRELQWGDIYRNYNSVIVITVSNNNNLKNGGNIDYFFKEIITEDELRPDTNLAYFRTSINILKNKDHYFRTNIVPKKYFDKIIQSSEVNESELVLSFFEMNEENTRKYCDFYKSPDDIVETDSKITMYNYYVNNNNLKYNTSSCINYNNIITHLKDSDYWRKKDNLNINITLFFVDREFNDQRNNLHNFAVIVDRNNTDGNIDKNTDKNTDGNIDKNTDGNTDGNIDKNTDGNVTAGKLELKKKNGKMYGEMYFGNDDGEKLHGSDKVLLDKLNGSGVVNKVNNEVNNEVNKYYNRTAFVDPSTFIMNKKDGGRRTFYTSLVDSTYNNDNIIALFSQISDEKVKYDLMNNLLVSKEYCHLLINNKTLLENLKPMFDKYKNVFKYTFGYAWLTFYLEECVTRTKSSKKSRFSYDIDTASKLPVFPYIHSQLKQNPYITILVDDKELINDNTYGLSYIENYDGYGICDLATFKRRLNIFTSGDPNVDPLKGLNWENFAVSGSAIPACLQKRSPLLDELVKKNNNDEDVGFNSFSRKYYGDSDIDLMSNERSIIKFLESVGTVYDLMKTNLGATESDRNYEVVKILGVSITEHFYTNYLDDFNKTYNLNVTREKFEEMSDTMIFKLYIYTKYIKNKNTHTSILLKENNIDITNKFVLQFLIFNNYDTMNIYKLDSSSYDNYNLVDTDIIFKQNDFREPENKLNENDNRMVIKFSEGFRFKLKCKNTNIEVFRIKDKEFYNTVARFHFPCVRSYYTGTNLHMLPSCVTSMMTGINMEYKYFAGIRNPNEIINKYVRRGFGVILNKYERNIWLEYNKSEENKYVEFKCTDQNQSTLLGVKTPNNPIFKLDNVDESRTKIYDMDDIKKYYNSFLKNSPVDFTKMTTISPNGDINKYCESYVDYCYELMNQ